MDKKTVVVTLYGTGDIVNDFTVTVFDSDGDIYDNDTIREFIRNINELELKDDKWIHASVVRENEKIKLKKPVYIVFDMIGTFHDVIIQKVIREVDAQTLAKALKTAKEETLNAILRNMSKKAADMLLEDIKYMGPIPIVEAKAAQNQIIDIFRHLVDIGEIVMERAY